MADGDRIPSARVRRRLISGGSQAVRLVAPGEDGLLRLLRAATTGADAHEVMPVETSATSWTAEREAALLAFHRSRSLSARPVERTWPVLVGHGPSHSGRQVAGAERAEPRPGGHTEVGVWIGRKWRGTGIAGMAGAELVALLSSEGETAPMAQTTAGNVAARAPLARLGATTRTDDEGGVHGRLPTPFA